MSQYLSEKRMAREMVKEEMAHRWAMSHGWGALFFWFFLLTLFIYLILFSVRPSFILNAGAAVPPLNNDINYAFLLGYSVLFALIVVVILYILCRY